jgi:hypothetical protein
LRELEPDGFSFLRLIHRFDKYDLIPNSEIEKRSLCGKGYGHRD